MQNVKVILVLIFFRNIAHNIYSNQKYEMPKVRMPKKKNPCISFVCLLPKLLAKLASWIGHYRL
jgi:hypothetical protein